MKIILGALVLSFFSAWVAADTIAKIDSILMFEGGNLVYIYPVGGVQNKPACHGSNGDYLSFSMARPMAKEYLSVLMMAFVAGKTVSFRTAGACLDQSVSDTIYYISVRND
ncbi:MAG: hypothetical protein KJ556_11890 [Gammaproteobacteria bacterium]|nr:hypothetical protein [Gammaproteobacteria bacterium]MBU2059924.1 hypothetical protein [Gammaproteobacteria bacterium]MBU2175821.1 hypothetical protein [Gammaproteobacteria bacterium]MBU2247644.1 hypothetical protein [Gammaproteobacteria bacterium]MBU2342959.1 hypothetical protein [Gammaproteobacteria bacterium]